MYKKFAVFIILVAVFLQKQVYAETEDIEGFLKKFYAQTNSGFHYTKLVVQDRVNKTIIHNNLSIELMTLRNDIKNSNLSEDTPENIDYIRENFEILAVDTKGSPLWEAYFYNMSAQLDLLEENIEEDDMGSALETIDQILDSIYFVNKEEV